MKKWLAALLCTVMLFSLLPSLAGAESITTVMTVANCNDWVSLREKADASSKRLLKVHLGEFVCECEDGGNGFIKCAFGGKTGYIQSKYLKATDLTGSEGILKNQMVVKVEEWVSLREQPDTSSKRLAKVPLGAVVTQCMSWNGNFVCCTYKGQTGYIATQYLTDADWDWLDNQGKTYDAVPDTMQVINCNEWVSLRQLPSSKSPQLVKVPLGAVVTGCEQVSDKFIACNYDGKSGYIMKDYLGEYTGFGDEPGPDVDDPEPEEDLPAEGEEDVNPFLKFSDAAPSWQELTLTGEPVLDEYVGEYYVIARYAATINTEWLYAACYDAEKQPVWSTMTACDGRTELTGVDAFIAGTADDPLLVIFTVGEGFKAYAVGPVKAEVWTLEDENALSVSGCLVHVLDEDGTIYACGYYDNAPICISRWGDFIWAGVNENAEIYWPYRMDLTAEGVDVYYDCIPEDEGLCYKITYSRDGSMLFCGTADTPDYEPLAEED